MILFSFKCSRITLIALNTAYLVISIALIALAAYARLSALVTSISIVGGIIACGVFLFILAIVGLVGTLRHNQVILFFYIVLLCGLFLIQFSIACACLSMSSANQEEMLTLAWKKSTNDTKLDVMRTFNCCGFQRTDLPPWDPLGCPPCKLANLTCCETDKGKVADCCQGPSGNSTNPCPCMITCLSAVQQKLDKLTQATGATSLFFSVTELIGAWIAVRFRHRRDPTLDPDQLM